MTSAPPPPDDEPFDVWVARMLAAPADDPEGRALREAFVAVAAGPDRFCPACVCVIAPDLRPEPHRTGCPAGNSSHANT